MPYFFLLLLMFGQTLSLTAQSSPDYLPPFLYPLIKQAKEEARQGQVGSATQKVRVLLEHYQVTSPLFSIHPEATNQAKTGMDAPTTDLWEERKSLEKMLSLNPADATTRNRLLEIAQTLDDQPEVLRHQAVLNLNGETESAAELGKLFLLILFLALIVHQLRALIRQIGWWKCS